MQPCMWNQNDYFYYFCRFKNGVELRPSGRVRMNRDGNKAILTINDVHDDDAGDITCELSNRRGKETATAKLKVQS